MCAAKRKSPKNRSRQQSRAESVVDAVAERPSAGLAAVAVALFIARFLMPTEATAAGMSLWLTQCWLALLILWIIDASRRGRLKWRMDRFDLAVGLIVCGHLISAMNVLISGGDRRAALNLLWEWVGLGVGFVLIRQTVRTREDVRRFIRGLVAVVGSVAAFGLYQHYVWYPRQSDWLQSKRQELAQLEKDPVTYRREIQQLQEESQREGVPLAGRGLRQFEDRLRGREPLGLFALTNTLAGILGLFFLPAIAALIYALRRERNRWAVFGSVAILLLIGDCLLLTKSRTAWVGVLCGLFIWWFLQRKQMQMQMQTQMEVTGSRKRMLGGVAAVVVVAAIVAATFTGGVDQKVLTESSKSLRYRFEYWSGTVSVLKERPLFGTGPGNFRSHYLKYKLPESSEEISDPHNFLLDAWVSGGIVALAGLLLFLVFGWRACSSVVRQDSGRCKNAEAAEAESEGLSRGASSGSGMWIAGVLGSFLLVLAADKLLVAGFRSELSWLMAGCVLLLTMTPGRFVPGRLSSSCLFAAWVVLLVHLLGAGGMEMPAVVQLLLILPILASRLATTAESEAVKTEQRNGKRNGKQPTRFSIAVIWSSAAMTLFYVCLKTATVPVQMCQWNLAAGRGVFPDIAKQQRYFTNAAESDPLNPEPQERLADLAFRRWQRQPLDPTGFETAVKHQRLVIDLNPDNSRSFYVLGERYAAKFAVTANETDAVTAVTAFQEALKRYPQHSLTVAHLAILLSRMKSRQQEAKTMARRALELDQINKARNHRDKLLQKGIRESLEAIRNGRLP